MDIVNNYLIQLGAVGIIIIGLIFFSRYLFVYLMGHLKEQIEENKKLETAFREYLIKNSQEHHQIIQKNTEVYKELIELIKVYAAILRQK